MKSRKSMALAMLCLLISTALQAKLRLPNVLSDNMILQSDADARLWGWGDVGKTVSISASWTKSVIKTKVGSDGRWSATVKTPAAGYDALTITVSDGTDKLSLRNILSGEVWVCTGQSNMQMTMKGFDACPTEGYLDALVEAQHLPMIRYVKIPSDTSFGPREDADCHWEVLSMETVGDCCAVGYFFAKLLNKAIDVPVGLVMANRGGSRVESWLSRENLEKLPDIDLKALETAKLSTESPLVWGNGTFSPILNYTIKGILFYQGCSNVKDPGNQYSDRLAMLAEQWRSQMSNGRTTGPADIPFYFVEIAPCTWKSVDGEERAFLREQQQRAQTLIPNSALVCTNDCVYPHEWRQIHPTQKKPIGERLAFIALNRDYGMKDIMCESPQFDRMDISNDTCTVWLKNDYGAISRYEDIEGFEMAGEDRVFHKAHAIHKKRKGIILTCPEVPKPVAVRYCFRNFQLGNIKNRAGLPLFPFRTDDWESNW